MGQHNSENERCRRWLSLQRLAIIHRDTTSRFFSRCALAGQQVQVGVRMSAAQTLYIHTRERDACSRPCAGPSRARDAHVVPDGGTVGEQQEFRNANVTYQEFRNANVTYKIVLEEGSDAFLLY
jgi:hypothetical protein